MTSAEAIDRSHADRLFASSEPSLRWRWFWLALLGMCVPMLIPYLLGMWDFEHYQYFPFVFLAVGYLAYTRWDGVFRAPRGWIGWVLVALGITGIVASLLLPSAWLAGVAFVLLAVACLDAMSGPDDRRLVGVGLPLLMLIQLPVGLDRMLIIRLQNATTELSSVVLDIMTVPHAVSGNVIQLASRELFVAEACSGIQSVFTLAFLACVIVAWNRRRLWLTPLYLLIAIVLAVAGNVFRVTAIAAASAWWGADLASGWQHEMIGYLALGAAGLLLLSFDQLVITLLHPTAGGGPETADNPIIRGWNYLVAGWRYSGEETGYGYRPEADIAEDREPRQPWLEKLVLGRVGLGRPGWYALLGSAALITLGAVTQAMRVEVNRDPQPLIRADLLFDPSPGLLEGEYRVLAVDGHESTRDGAEPRLGQNADLWEFRARDPEGETLEGQLVVSQTYSGWHELCVCYENLNWDLIDREVCVTDPESMEVDQTGSYVTARFKRPDGQYGYLLFAAVNADGSFAEAPSSWGALGARFFSRLERHGVVNQQDLAMLQLWMVTPGKIEPEMLRDVQLDFMEIRDRVASAITDGAASPASPPVAAGSTQNDGEPE